MKLIFLVLTLMSFKSFAANHCTIDVENEISGDPSLQKLFPYVSLNKNILARKGYKLISASGPLPSHVAYISRERTEGYESLVILFHDMIHAEPKIFRVRNFNDRSSVIKLLKSLPLCK